ncbi:MAG: fluoride efflux transporter CrcB [Verrucomicrobia bacterium]|nr:MAG: fluoride efflux transporter CrcB [Verrucomicrobiota bacterium]
MKAHWLWVALGGALGSLARFGCSGWVARAFGETFPWGTLTVNVAGSFIIGLLATVGGPEGRWLMPPAQREFLWVGMCGGFTTFSSFSLQTLNLMQDGEWFRAGANAVGSVVLCLLAVWLGAVFGQWLNWGRS